MTCIQHYSTSHIQIDKVTILILISLSFASYDNLIHDISRAPHHCKQIKYQNNNLVFNSTGFTNSFKFRTLEKQMSDLIRFTCLTYSLLTYFPYCYMSIKITNKYRPQMQTIGTYWIKLNRWLRPQLSMWNMYNGFIIFPQTNPEITCNVHYIRITSPIIN